MTMDKIAEIAAVLNLKSHEGIALEIAERQLEVITKSYEFLSKKENNIIYIADEVGLGKTYIGLGIATLVRHFSKRPAAHRDVMIVPKKNLQDKWLKELRNFGARNYKMADDDYKRAIIADGVIKDRLRPVGKDNQFSIYRMTSFSSLVTSRQLLRRYFTEQVFNHDPFCEAILYKAYELKYFNNDYRGLLIRLVACLLNAVSERIGCLIIDEAHNYKYGPGGEDGDGSVRNNVTARFLGAIKDKEILKTFPELRRKMKYPLAKKIICLSATPKDRDLREIKNQLACFAAKHVLMNTETADEIKELFPSFLIRGNMEYSLGGIVYSRNQCRHEHRLGNVKNSPSAGPILLEENFDNVFWQLLQYKSIRHLSQKANASFEIGMLAGFESYQIDMDKRLSGLSDDEGDGSDNREYEITKSRKQKDSEDANVIRTIVNAYKDSFGNEPPPHPKLSRLEDELIRQFQRQEKSLIFVRRIATVDELQTQLLQRYDQEIVTAGHLKLDGNWARFLSDAVKLMKKSCIGFYTDRKRAESLQAVSEIARISDWWDNHPGVPWEAYFIDLLNYCYRQADSDLIDLIDNYLKNGKFSRAKITAVLAALKRYFNTWKEEYNEPVEIEAQNDEPEIRTDSFYKNYFKKGAGGFRFKQKIYRENWFDLNVYLLFLDEPAWSGAAKDARMYLGDHLIKTKDRRPHQVFNDFQAAFKMALIQKGNTPKKISFGKGGNPLFKNTFLNILLLTCCEEEWKHWKENKKELPLDELLKNIAALNSLLQAVFQNGSGLLPAFIAESRSKNFNYDLIALMKQEEAPFHFVLREIRTIIKDFNLIISVNFQDMDAKKIAEALKNMSPVVGASGQDKNRSAIATRFRMPGFPYALIATDIFHEGEDLHTYCQEVYHYGIAWNPSGIEQRTGRIDRINSLSYRKLNQSQELTFNNKVQVFYPYLTRSIEVNQVVKLLRHVNKFLEDFNDIDAVQNYDSQVQLNEEISATDIPAAIERRLYSKYDVGSFKG
jgi:hypothetical protein